MGNNGFLEGEPFPSEQTWNVCFYTEAASGREEGLDLLYVLVSKLM